MGAKCSLPRSALNLAISSLTRDPTLRPAPAGMLEHPWIVSMMQQKVDMAYWMRKVWGWKNQKSHRYALLHSSLYLR